MRLVWLCLLPVSALAAPMTLSHQGRLLDVAGAPINGGSHALSLSLWRSAAGTNVGTDQLYAESFAGVAPASGFYSVELGAGGALDSGIFATPEVWLEVTLDGSVVGARQRLSSAPMAAYAVETSRFSASAAACDGSNPADLGTVRWTGSTFEGCVGSGWVNFASAVPGKTAAVPAKSCLEIHTVAPAEPDGPYWLNPTGTGAAFQAYCDMAGGGWTLVARMTVASGQAHNTASAVGVSATAPVQVNTTTTQKFSDTVINDIRVASPYGGTTAYKMTCWDGTANAQTMYCSSACVFNAPASVNAGECSHCTGSFEGALVQLTPNTGTHGLGHHHDYTYPWTMAWQRHPEEGTNPGCRNDLRGSGDGHLWIR